MSNSNAQTDPILITFPPSLDSELARFLLSHYGVRHFEQRHTFIFSFFATLWHAQTFIFPVLYSDTFKLIGPRPISEYFDTRGGPTLELWPSLQDQKRQAEADWNQFNDTLAFASAKFAYFYLLPHRDLMIEPLTQGAPDFEVKAVTRAYSVFAGLLSTALGLSQKKADESLAQIRTVFVSVDARLADGRKFLVGDRLSISDLAFAVAAAPVLLPAKYGGPIPPYEQMPAAIQSAVSEMRAHPAGAYALRIYKEYR
jgi:glutathione S-transferase